MFQTFGELTAQLSGHLRVWEGVIVAVATTSNRIYISQCQALNPWLLWLQNPSAARTVKFIGDEPLLAI